MNTNNSDHLNDISDVPSLRDIIRFIQESWKIIILYIAMGITVAALFLALVPNQYEARAQIKLAQVSSINTGNSDILGINLEEPNALISRMKMPSAYPKMVIAACGLTDEDDVEMFIRKKLDLLVPKGVNSIVDLRVRGASKEVAKECMSAIVQLIVSSQSEIMAPFIEGAKKKLIIYNKELKTATNLILKADQSGAVITAAYLNIRDEIRYLNEEIRKQQSILIDYEARMVTLNAPIYVKNDPVYPEKLSSLLIGILFGGFLGLVFALARKSFQFNGFNLKH